MPTKRATSITIATAMKKAASRCPNSRVFCATTFSLGAAPSGARSRVIVRVISRFDAAPASPTSSPVEQVALPVSLPAAP